MISLSTESQTGHNSIHTHTDTLVSSAGQMEKKHLMSIKGLLHVKHRQGREEELKSSAQRKQKERTQHGEAVLPQLLVSLDSQSQLTAWHRELSLAIIYMYIGVSCPVRSLNMAAGMVFM